MGYIDCEPNEWGYVAKFCSTSQKPIWIDVADICTPKKKLINPPYGSNMMEYEIEVHFYLASEFRLRTSTTLPSLRNTNTWLIPLSLISPMSML